MAWLCIPSSRINLVLILFSSLLLLSCKVGPNFRPPPSPLTKNYIKDKPIKNTLSSKAAGKNGQAQHFVLNKTIPAEWWRLFQSPELVTLIEAGLAHSPNIAAAKAALNQAQATYQAQIGTLFPTVTANFSGQRQRFSLSQFGGQNETAAGSRVFNLFNANVAVNYTLDVFGGLRRQIESLGAQRDYQLYELEAAYLALTSNITTTTLTIASLRAQLALTQQLVSTQKNTLSIIQKQLVLGGASDADVLLQQNQLAQTQATILPLKQALAVNLHLLSTLIGELPREDLLSRFNLNDLKLPTDLPISCPSALVQQRPDIKAAEALVHAASANIGVAIANMLPQFTLTGNYGWQSIKLNKLFNDRNNIWSMTGNVAQTLFQGGTLINQKRAAVAAFDQAAALYKQTVLQAFQNVADALDALGHDAQLLKTLKEAEIASHNSFILTQKQYRLGGSNYLNLLTAERAYQQAAIDRIQAETARFTDTAALFQALGGGWWNQSLNCPDSENVLCKNQ